MKVTLVVCAAGMLGLGAAACGEAGKAAGAGVAAGNAVSPGKVALAANGLRGDDDEDGNIAIEKERNRPDYDGDSDKETGAHYDAEDEGILFYGHPAHAADARAITAVVRHYYAAAVRGDGAAVCAAVSTSLARTARRQYGEGLGLPGVAGRTCGEIMSELTKQLHQRLSVGATLEVGLPRVEGDSGRVMLGFEGAWPTRYTEVRREHGAWKVDALLDTELP